jgi:tRNA/tmRNA/rRNA uracil-C5-methylase (TrmA/RlmC/RlmD family)
LANDKQFKTRAGFIATRGVREYRATIPFVVGSDDTVLELGCEWGTTTALLAQTGALVIGTDISRDCIDRARKSHPKIRFEALDAFDIRGAMRICADPTKIYIDLSGFSGYRSLLDVIALTQTYAAVLNPGTIVVKSGALKHFANRCTPWNNS